jgi:hypothetical protein
MAFENGKSVKKRALTNPFLGLNFNIYLPKGKP